jgi:hypothetical protein
MLLQGCPYSIWYPFSDSSTKQISNLYKMYSWSERNDSLQFPHKSKRCLWFQLLVRWLYLICVICVCFVVSNTYCVVFLFCFSSYWVSYVASLYVLSIFDCPFGIFIYILLLINIFLLQLHRFLLNCEEKE